MQLRSLLDRTSVESFVGGRRAVVTAVSREPMALKAFGVGVFGTRSVKMTAKLHGMGCGWLDANPSSRPVLNFDILTGYSFAFVAFPAVKKEKRL